MKSIFMASLFVFAQSAQALKPASKAELAELTEIFVIIKGVQEKVEANRTDHKRANPRMKAVLDAELTPLLEERDAPCRQAMWLTMKAYGLLQFQGDRPILPRGVSFLRSPEIGKEITWVPVFEEKQAYDIQDARGNPADNEKLKLLEDGGNTASDGVSRIFPDAFTSPAELASTIYHEKIHFEQFTTYELGGLKTPAELEVDAYSKQKKALENDVLDMTAAEKKREADYLNTQLAKYRAKASIQRARVDKAKGLPIDEYSIVSHSDSEIKKLIAQAREQLQIAYRDHDERLITTVAELAARSCLSPGSVTQAELDALPSPHNRENIKRPPGVNGCELVIFNEINAGSMAGTLKRRATPEKALPIQAAPPPFPPARASPPLRANPIQSGVPLSTVLLELKQQAELACQNQGRILVERNLFNPPGRYFQEPRNEQTVADIKAGLGFCEGHVFQRFFEMLRDERGKEITERWLIDTVESAPTGAVQGGGGSNPCERNGDPFGCQPRR